MEKVIYVLWRDPRIDVASWSLDLRDNTARRLLELGALAVQLNVADDAVKPAARLAQVATRPQMQACLHVWLSSSVRQFRQPLDDEVAAAAWRMAAYLVTESQPIVNTRHPPLAGGRTHGFSQLAFLRRPPRVPHEAWLDFWHNRHTQVAIDTQDNFQYTQNVVVRPLSYDAPIFDAIVEECFEPDAMTDPHAFFDARGDSKKLQENVALMMESCDRFIDRDKIDVVQTSQYVIKAFGGQA